MNGRGQEETKMQRPNRGRDVGGFIFGGLMFCGLVYWAGVGFSWWFDVHPIAAAVSLALAVGGAWFFGARHGQAAEEKANAAHKQAQKKQKEAEETQARAAEDRRIAAAAIASAEAQEAGARLKCMRQDIQFVRETRSLPLRSRIGVVTMIGSHPGEDWESFEQRRDSIIQKRVDAWETAVRYGHHLLSVVEAQNGLCGDPSKDPNRKGCGCYLYALPPTAVHLDHIVPRSSEGTDEIKNLQALCSACNISAGPRTDDT